MGDEKLYREMCELKLRIKDIAVKAGERAPQVCPDTSIAELARLKPTKLAELSCINGLGEAFTEKYGQQFLAVVAKYCPKNDNASEIDEKTLDTLKKLEIRLTDISRRSRMLKTSVGKFAIDLTDIDTIDSDKLLDLVLDMGKRKMLLAKRDRDEKLYKKINELAREIERGCRETGEDDLYLAYPFLSGHFDVDFPVLAPLMLFPASLVREGDGIYLTMDGDKDIIYNSSLFLLAQRYYGRQIEYVSNAVDNFDKQTFLNDMLRFYTGCGLELCLEELVANSQNAVQSIGDDGYFEETARGGTLFPVSLQLGENHKFAAQTAAKKSSSAGGSQTEKTHTKFKIFGAMVLGKFHQFSGSIQRDFSSIVGSGKLNMSVKALFDGVEPQDYYADSPSKSRAAAFSESDRVYISALNASQENVLATLETAERLVIQGPPGTGKSQTIISIISDVVSKGKNVLMVSQKKAALDVIQSRLGKLSKYAFMVSDAKDKEKFYQKLAALFALPQSDIAEPLELGTVADEIEGKVRLLDMIENQLFSAGKYGVKMCAVYQENLHNQFLHDLTGMQKYYKFIDKELLNLPYSRICELRDIFTDGDLVDRVFVYLRLDAEYKFLRDIISGIDELTFAELTAAANQLCELKKQYQAHNIFARIFKKGKVKKQLRNIVKQYFCRKHSKKQCKAIYKNPQYLAEGLSNYGEYKAAEMLYKSLKEDEQSYIKSMFYCDGAMDVNDCVYDCIIRCIIASFESENADALAQVENFDRIAATVDSLIEKKRKLSIAYVEKKLWQSAQNIVGAKRAGEIKRVSESKRPMSVSKFMSKFSFEMLRGVKIWMMTPECVSELLPLDTALFDYVIFDEASQIYVENGIPTLSRASKAVIAGDHKQLRPSSLGSGRIEYTDEDGDETEQACAALEEESLLDLARFRYDEVMLGYHYRAKYEELIAFSNYAFYKGNLCVSPNSVSPTLPPIEVIKVDDGLWTKRANIAEAKRCVQLIKQLFSSGSSDSIGVITFNIGQRDTIYDMLDDECQRDREFAERYLRETTRKTAEGEDIGLFIKNIENVQGDERDCIIFSFAYAKGENGNIVRNFGWLNQRGGENRLNVAISRAKKKIYILTSIEPEELRADEFTHAGGKLLEKYLQYSQAVSRGDSSAALGVLRAVSGGELAVQNASEEKFKTELANRLTESGLNVVKNIGIGGYNIDIAIATEDGYELGIECDSTLYASSTSSRERDIHKRRYLMLRGWRLHRVWSHNMWRNLDREVRKIVELVKNNRV